MCRKRWSFISTDLNIYIYICIYVKNTVCIILDFSNLYMTNNVERCLFTTTVSNIVLVDRQRPVEFVLKIILVNYRVIEVVINGVAVLFSTCGDVQVEAVRTAVRVSVTVTSHYCDTVQEVCIKQVALRVTQYP